MLYPKLSAYIVHQPCDVRFLGIHSLYAGGNPFRAQRHHPAVISPGSRVASFRFPQNLFGFFSCGQHSLFLLLSQKHTIGPEPPELLPP
jgi:hypothetical protein